MSTQRYSKVVVVMWMCAVALSPAAPTLAETLTFQQGTNGYDRAQDASIRWAYTTNWGDSATVDRDHAGDVGAYEMWSTGAGRTSILEVGHFFQSTVGGFVKGVHTVEAGPVYRYSRMYIRFRDVFGTGAGQVPPGIGIASATLKLYNTEDLGSAGSAGGAVLSETLTGVDNVSLSNPHNAPKLNAGTISVYPSLIPISYGFDDGTSGKGKVTGKERRRGKQEWAQGQCCNTAHEENDPVAMAFQLGPADVGNPRISPGEEEIDSTHPGAINVLQDATEEFKDFDVLGLLDFLTGDGVFITSLSPDGQLPTLDINYGNAYRSSEFGDVYDKDGNLLIGGSAADIATRPMLVIELGGLAIPGDANGDSFVDVADLGILGANFNATDMQWNTGDFNLDGMTDVADLGILGANWSGGGQLPDAQSILGMELRAVIPEPMTLSLYVLSVLMVGRRRR